MPRLVYASVCLRRDWKGSGTVQMRRAEGTCLSACARRAEHIWMGGQLLEQVGPQGAPGRGAGGGGSTGITRYKGQ